MLSPAQMQTIWDLSDTVIYREAVEFMHRLVKTDGNDPLPRSQVQGLLNITGSSSYSQIEQFILHQRDRQWTQRQRNIEVFYKELDKTFKALKTQRLRREFHLVDEKALPQKFLEQVDTLMVYIVREFLQHLIAENNLLLKEKEDQRRSNYPPRNNQPPRRYAATNPTARNIR